MTLPDTPLSTAHDASIGEELSQLIDAIPLASLEDPLEYFFAEHNRHRTICSILMRISHEKRSNRAKTDRIVAFLTNEVIMHHADENEELFPALRQRALPEDGLASILTRLEDDHQQSEVTVHQIIAGLTARPTEDPVQLTSDICKLIQAYVSAEQRHLAIENSVVLAIARIRLTRSDLKKISIGMKARRGDVH